VLIVLPPSEGKAASRRGAPLDLGSLSFGSLGPQRARVLDALAAASAGPDAHAVLGVAPGLADQVARNVRLREAPAQPAARTYTGVLYEALGLARLSPGPRARAERSIVVVSALFGALRPSDAIPAYRLAMDVDLPGIGPLATAWRPVLDPVLTEAAGEGPIVDCRSAAYAAAWRPPRALAERVVQVRVVRDDQGVRSVVSHMAKQTRGQVARRLVTTKKGIADVCDVIAALRGTFEVETTAPGRAGSSWTLDVVLRGGPVPSR
jgi:hypothetical protein